MYMLFYYIVVIKYNVVLDLFILNSAISRHLSFSTVLCVCVCVCVCLRACVRACVSCFCSLRLCWQNQATWRKNAKSWIVRTDAGSKEPTHMCASVNPDLLSPATANRVKVISMFLIETITWINHTWVLRCVQLYAFKHHCNILIIKSFMDILMHSLISNVDLTPQFEAACYCEG